MTRTSNASWRPGSAKELLLEVITIVAASTITNYTGSVTNPPLEAALQANEWKS